MAGVQHILIVAPLPPPVNGQSVVSRRMVDQLGREALAISLTPSKVKSRFLRAVFFSWVLLRLVVVRLTADLSHVYFTCSRTALGGLRDIALIHLFRNPRYRIVNHVHGADVPRYVEGLPPWWQRVVRAHYRRVDVAVALTEGMTADLGTYFQNVEVVHNSYPAEVDAYEWERVHAAKTPEVRAGSPLRVILLSTLAYSKGVVTLMRAIERLNHGGVPVRLTVIGGFEGDEHRTLDALRTEVRAAAQELGDVVTLLGHVTDVRTKLDHLLHADVFCLPSFYRSEGAPLSVIEAMSMGCAVVATRAGYLSEIVPGEAGWRLADAGIDAVVDALAAAARDNRARAARQEAAYRHAREQYSPRTFAREVRRLFDRRQGERR